MVVPGRARVIMSDSCVVLLFTHYDSLPLNGKSVTVQTLGHSLFMHSLHTCSTATCTALHTYKSSVQPCEGKVGPGPPSSCG